MPNFEELAEKVDEEGPKDGEYVEVNGKRASKDADYITVNDPEYVFFDSESEEEEEAEDAVEDVLASLVAINEEDVDEEVPETSE